jgi:hypothetical protein
MVGNVARLLSARLLTLELGQQTRRELEITWLGPMKRSLSREPLPHPRQRFSRVSGTRRKVSVFKAWERREPFGLSLRPSRWLWRSGFSVLALDVEL